MRIIVIADGDNGIARHDGRSTLTAAIDTLADGAVLDVHGGMTCRLLAVCSQIAATIDMTQVVAAACTAPFHIHGNITINSSAGIVATEDVLHDATCDVELDITSHVGLVSTAIDCADAFQLVADAVVRRVVFVVEVVVLIVVVIVLCPCARTTYRDGSGIAGSLVAAAIDFGNLHVAGAAFCTLVYSQRHATENRAVEVTTGKDFIYRAACDAHADIAGDVGCLVAMSMVILIHVEAGLVAMPTAIDVMRDGAAADSHICSRHVSCITAAIDITDLCITLLDDHRRCGLSCYLGCVTAAIDIATHDGLISTVYQVTNGHRRSSRSTLKLSCILRIAITAAIDISAYRTLLDVDDRRTGILCQVTTAEHIGDRHRGCRLLDVYLHRALRSAIDIVTAEDIGHAAAVDVHRHGSVDAGFNAFHGCC